VKSCKSKNTIILSAALYLPSANQTFHSLPYPNFPHHNFSQILPNYTPSRNMSHTLCFTAFVLGLMFGMATTILTYLLIRYTHSQNTRPTNGLRRSILRVSSSANINSENGNQDDEQSSLIQSNSSTPNGEPSPLFIPRARDMRV
jgi:hypothetical protein